MNENELQDIQIGDSNEETRDLLNRLTNVKTEMKSTTTFYNRLKQLPDNLKIIRIKHEGEYYNIYFYSLEDSLARLFSSYNNCKDLYLSYRNSNDGKCYHYFQTNEYKQLCDYDQHSGTLILSVYADDYPLTDRLNSSSSNVVFYVCSFPWYVIKQNTDGYLLWGSNDSSIPVQCWLKALMEDIKQNKKIRVYHPVVQHFINVEIVIKGVFSDSVERNKLAFVRSLVGESSVCVKCKKLYSELDEIHQDCGQRSKQERDRLLYQLFNRLREEEQDKIDREFKKFMEDYGYLPIFQDP